MKYILPILVLCFCFCKDAPKPIAPVTPTQSDTIQAWYCTPIAPLPALKRAVGMRGKFWQTGQVIKIGFIGGTTAQRDIAKAAFAEWAKYANLKFEYPTSGATNIRVAFNPGSAWSHLGIDCNAIGQGSQTMNLGFGGIPTALHEVGHSLGLAHEHSTPNQKICWKEDVVIKELQGSPNFWSVEQIRFNVLDALQPANVITTPFDQNSIMLYSIPGRWTCDGAAYTGGSILSNVDKSFIAERYPYTVVPPKSIQLTPAQVDSILNIMALRVSKYQQMLAESQKENAVIKKMLGR